MSPRATTESYRSACSSTSASVIYDAFFRKCARIADRTTAPWCCIRSAARRAPAAPTRGSPNTSSRAAISRHCPRCCRRSSAPGLLVTDIEILRLHYAETLKAWRERFLAHREDAERLYDARFVRMWEFYLGRRRNVVPPAEPDGFPDPADQASGHRADHPRLHRRRRGAAARARRRRSIRRCGSPASNAISKSPFVKT